MTGIAAHGGGGLLLPVAPPFHRSRRRHQRWQWQWQWSTPARLRVRAAAVIVLACCLVALTAALLSQVREEFGAIGQTDEPEAIAATNLYFKLTDMDGSAADVLLVGTGTALVTAAQTDHQYYVDTYAADRVQASRDLAQAVVAETGNAAARQQLSSVLAQLGQYEALIADAELLSQQAHDPTGKPSPDVSASYDDATRLMQTAILPQVSDLAASSQSGLNRAYSDAKLNAAAGVVCVVVLGLVVIAALVALQVLLAVRFQRRINPALALATVLAIAFTAAAGTRFYAAYTHAHVARYDSFSSLQALSMAYAVSNNADADESRFLVDPARAAQYEQAYLSKAQEIVNVGKNAGYDQYLPLLNADIAAYQRNNADIRFGGYLGQEFRNITFPGERQAAVSALLAFRAYETDDRTLRALAQTSLAAAVSFDIGVARSQSDGAFNAYATALRSDIAINSAAFNQAVADGQGSASPGFLALAALAAVGVAALTYAGVRSRLAEYR